MCLGMVKHSDVKACVHLSRLKHIYRKCLSPFDCGCCEMASYCAYSSVGSVFEVFGHGQFTAPPYVVSVCSLPAWKLASSVM